MFTQHAVFAQPHTTTANEQGEDDTASEPETSDAESQTQDTVTDNAHETDDTDSDTQADPAPDWTVPPASTFLRFYSDEPGYLKTNPARDVSTSDTVLTASEEPTSLRVVPPTDSITHQPEDSLTPSPSLTAEEGSSSVPQPDLETPTPQWGQYRQELPSLSLWDASPTPTQRTNYLSRSCSICEKQMVTPNPFKTLTCHACLQWVQKSLDPEDRYHNEERDTEEGFQFQGIPIAGENDGDSEESWERESWDTGDDSATEKDSITNNFQWAAASWAKNAAAKQGEKLPRVSHPRIVHTLGTEDITFWVGPRKDGIVKTHTTSSFILTTNYYQPLADETYDYPPVPVPFNPTSNRRTWFSTRANELHRLVVGQSFYSVTNAQNQAHPWKTHKQETNRQQATT
jgi:hypothetical protein